MIQHYTRTSEAALSQHLQGIRQQPLALEFGWLGVGRECNLVEKVFALAPVGHAGGQEAVSQPSRCQKGSGQEVVAGLEGSVPRGPQPIAAGVEAGPPLRVRAMDIFPDNVEDVVADLVVGHGCGFPRLEVRCLR